MKQAIIENHKLDANGKPAGGTTSGKGFCVHWQNGPLVKDGQRIEPNGAFVETIIEVAKGRLAHYQSTAFACEHNARAIEHLNQALEVLNLRTAERQARGVEGTHEV